MKTYRFNTDIHCKNCVSKVEKFLNKFDTISNWNIDESTKILEIQGYIDDLSLFEDKFFEETQVYTEIISD